ncbi:xanthine dehydrogenase small subunit [Lacimonas salitolerans]|uniref:Xanthine dehydrogenase small subunit n=1 Tax=Lacimonas salitolerans TaxID=1323750 RepID=A0ABW4EL16_9RHOB
MSITFLLNGERVELRDIDPLMTALDWLRETRGLTATKEGCNEGDCGACTVMVTDAHGARALNACILFLPQLHGRALRTVEGISAPDGQLHPVQAEMVAHHGSQCGFCTPGFIASMAVSHLNGDTDPETALAGNLCRCTGYAPILRAARAAQPAPVPAHLHDDPDFLSRQISSGGVPAGDGGQTAPQRGLRPETTDDLARLCAAHPDATLIAGATDVGLWVTKQMRALDKVIFLNRCADLQTLDAGPDTLRIGAGVTMDRVLTLMETHHPSYAAMIRRYGSAQVRAAATIGGNIANGSPIGDNPPALIALGARLYLRHGDTRREIALQDFFIDYGKQDRAAGEFVEAVTLPASAPDFRCYKISKRFDQDISALLGAFNITVTDGIVTDARIAFGGMAGIPKRADQAETALIGQSWSLDTVRTAQAAIARDFTPLSDMRASANYRLTVAQNLLERYFHELTGTYTDLREVQA